MVWHKWWLFGLLDFVQFHHWHETNGAHSLFIIPALLGQQSSLQIKSYSILINKGSLIHRLYLIHALIVAGLTAWFFLLSCRLNYVTTTSKIFQLFYEFVQGIINAEIFLPKIRVHYNVLWHNSVYSGRKSVTHFWSVSWFLHAYDSSNLIVS